MRPIQWIDRFSRPNPPKGVLQIQQQGLSLLNLKHQ